tara:strand:- start:843 stop:1265 length:423 start_codon:yes stop_codon:yes gene_type:complete
MAKNRKMNEFTQTRHLKNDSGLLTDGLKVPKIIQFDFPGTDTLTIPITCLESVTVIDAWVALDADGGNNANKVEIFNNGTTNQITDDLVIGTAGIKDVVRAAEIDTTYDIIAAGNTLNVKCTDSGATDIPACRVFVMVLA